MRTGHASAFLAAIWIAVTCVVSPGTSFGVVYGVSLEVDAGRNNRIDASAEACDPNLGCFTTTGARCADSPDERCDLQVVPAGRCSAGVGSCVWPQGAGRCEHDGGGTPVDPVSCLTDDYVAFLRGERPHPGETTSGPSVMCSDVVGSNGNCDMSTNDATCDCDGTDPAADPGNTDDEIPSWEGSVCGPGSVHSVCSDGDPLQGSGLGVASCSGSGCMPTDEGALTGAKYQWEKPGEIFTLQRKAGVGASPPSAGGPIRPLRSTLVLAQDDVGTGDFSAQGLRRLRTFSSGHHVDSWFNSIEVTGSPDETSAYFFCDVPLGQGWGPDRPLSGRCALDSDALCVQDSDCGLFGPCDPSTFRYCHESDGDPSSVEGTGVETTGFLFTRALTPAETSAAGGICPPACLSAYRFDTFEQEAVTEAARGGDFRAGLQLVFDHLEGAPAAAGSFVLPIPLVQASAIVLGDNRCAIGGDPDRDPNQPSIYPGNPGLYPDDIGRCVSSGNSCDPRRPTGSNGCPGLDSCRFCHGTADADNAPDASNTGFATVGGNYGFDPANGNAEALPVGYQTHGIAALDIRGRTGFLNGVTVNFEVPILLVLTNGPAAAEFKDNTCIGSDTCEPGEVVGGGVGIGVAPTYINANDPVPHEPTGPGYLSSLTIPAHNPGTPQGVLGSPADWGVGADGFPDCFGAHCVEVDDVTLRHDFSPAQDGSDLRLATQSEAGPLNEVFAISPVYRAVAAHTVRDLTAIGSDTDLVHKFDLSLCPILRIEDDGNLVSTCLDSDLDQDGWLDEQDGCPLNPSFATGPDTGGVASSSDPGGFLPDGILDSCQCGDVNDDGRVSGNDATAITRACLRLEPYEGTVVSGEGCQGTQTSPTPFVVEKCDVGGPFPDGVCSGTDATIVKRTTLSLPPGIDLTCTAYLP